MARKGPYFSRPWQLIRDIIGLSLLQVVWLVWMIIREWNIHGKKK